MTDDLLTPLHDLARRAETEGDAVLPAVRRLLDQAPELWRALGDLARRAELAVIDAAAQGEVVAKESLRRWAEELRTEIAGPSPTPLESLLAANIVTSWLETSQATRQVAEAAGQATPSASRPLLRWQESAQRRLLAAVKGLAVVRKLLVRAPAPVEVATRLEKKEATRRSATSFSRPAVACVTADN